MSHNHSVNRGNSSRPAAATPRTSANAQSADPRDQVRSLRAQVQQSAAASIRAKIELGGHIAAFKARAKEAGDRWKDRVQEEFDCSVPEAQSLIHLHESLGKHITDSQFQAVLERLPDDIPRLVAVGRLPLEEVIDLVAEHDIGAMPLNALRHEVQQRLALTRMIGVCGVFGGHIELLIFKAKPERRPELLEALQNWCNELFDRLEHPPTDDSGGEESDEEESSSETSAEDDDSSDDDETEEPDDAADRDADADSEDDDADDRPRARRR